MVRPGAAVTEIALPGPGDTVQARIALYINYGPANADAYKTGIIKPEVAAKLPKSFERRPVETIVTGTITKQAVKK